MVDLEYCLANVDCVRRQELAALRDRAGVRVYEADCLGRCGECYAAPFVVLNGECIPADQLPAQLDNVKNEATDP